MDSTDPTVPWSAELAADIIRLTKARSVLVVRGGDLVDALTAAGVSAASGSGDRRYDLAVYLGPMPALDAPEVLEALAAASDHLLYSGLEPDGTAEVADAIPEPELAALLADHGLLRTVTSHYSVAYPGAWLFERRVATVTDVVRDYERALAGAQATLEATRRHIAPRLTATPGPLIGADADLAQRHLAMLDQIIGLRAEAAEARYERDMAVIAMQGAIEHETLLKGDVLAIRASATWRLGRVAVRMLGPFARLFRR